MKLQLKRSNVIESGAAKEPTASQLEYGELAINYNTTDPAIFLKDSNNNVIRISGIGNIADDGQVELPASTTPPLNPEAGNLWYNSDDGRLYIYYNDGDSTQWVDASPDSWDPSSYPDVSDDTAQSNTLDDRYLMLNSANDPITGGLNITGGNVGIGTTSPATTLDVSGNAIIGETGGAEGGQITLRDSSGSSRGFLDISGTDVFRMFSTTADQDFIIGSFASNGNIYFYTNNQQRMRIDSGGNVGIGASSPVSKLQVAGDVNISGAANKFIGPTASEGSTAAAPTYSFSGQSTGMFLASNNNLGFSTGATERLRIDSNGNVGIGTDSPASKLHLADTSLVVTFEDTNSTSNSINQITNYEGTMILHVDPNDNSTVTESLRFSMRGSEAMRITSSGNVGIGASSPRAKLTISESAGSTTPAKMRIENAGERGVTVGFDDHNASPNFSIASGDQSIKFLSIDSNGNVGIGTSVPLELLHVNGAMTANNYFIGDRTNNASSGTIGNSGVAGYIQLWGSGSAQNGAVLFGTAAGSTNEIARFNQHGLTFSKNNVASNALDDFEVGTFTPTLGAVTTSPVYTTSAAEGFYTKVGRQVFFSLTITVTALSNTPSGNILITGLPFNGISSNNGRASGHVGYAVGFDNAVGSPVGWLMASNQNTLTLYRRSGDLTYINDVTGLPAGAITSGSSVRLSGSYMTN